MKTADLVRMANQIAGFWAVYPKAEALDSIAKHIHNSWEPRMRDALKAHIDKGGEGLSPLFLESMGEYFKGPKRPATAAAPAKEPRKSASQPSGA
jgi:formate dehydrogenase subunit delta